MTKQIDASLIIVEETGYESRQRSKIKTTVLQFLLEALLCFLFTNCD